MTETSPEPTPAEAMSAIESLERKVAHLERALGTSREISAAVGIIMATKRLGYDDAFSLLVTMSQTTNSKVRVLAASIVLTGEVPFHLV